MEKNVSAIYAFLTEEGFRPKYNDDDGVITFKHEGDSYVLIFKENDEEYVSVNKFIGVEFSDDISLEVFQLINGINSEYILGKGTIRENDDQLLILQVDSLGSHEDFKNNFERYLIIIQQMERAFVTGFNKLVS